MLLTKEMRKLFQLNMLQAYPVDDSWFETFCNAWRSQKRTAKSVRCSSINSQVGFGCVIFQHLYKEQFKSSAAENNMFSISFSFQWSYHLNILKCLSWKILVSFFSYFLDCCFGFKSSFSDSFVFVFSLFPTFSLPFLHIFPSSRVIVPTMIHWLHELKQSSVMFNV